MIPAMRNAGYDEDVGAAMTSVASCMGPIIPPSIPFIIYGSQPTYRLARCFSAACSRACSWGLPS